MSQKTLAPELLEELAEVVAASILENGGNSDLAKDAGQHVAETMSLMWGGQTIYFPKGVRARLHKKHLKIWEDFTGDNHSELARRYDMSVQHIYNIISAVRASEIAKRQPSLFDENEG